MLLKTVSMIETNYIVNQMEFDFVLDLWICVEWTLFLFD
jgi:hypothetical protein